MSPRRIRLTVRCSALSAPGRHTFRPQSGPARPWAQTRAADGARRADGGGRSGLMAGAMQRRLPSMTELSRSRTGARLVVRGCAAPPQDPSAGPRRAAGSARRCPRGAEEWEMGERLGDGGKGGGRDSE